MLTNVGMQHELSGCSLVDGMLSSQRNDFYISFLFGMLTNVGMQPQLSGCILVDGMLSSHRNDFYITLLFWMLSQIRLSKVRVAARIHVRQTHNSAQSNVSVAHCTYIAISGSKAISSSTTSFILFSLDDGNYVLCNCVRLRLAAP